MRLIDADAYKEVFERNASYYEDIGNYEMAEFNRQLAKSTDERPTAYDVNEVVEQLEKERTKIDELKTLHPNNSIGDMYCDGEINAYNYAIEIVKRGGEL